MSNLKRDIEEVLKPRFDISANVCAECGHNEWSHYWNGGVRPDLHSGWDSCKADGCKCVGDYETGELKTKLDVQYDEKELKTATTQIINLIESVVDNLKPDTNLLGCDKHWSDDSGGTCTCDENERTAIRFYEKAKDDIKSKLIGKE